jgi:hypothetical protein
LRSRIRCLSLSNLRTGGRHAEKESGPLLAATTVEPLFDGNANELGHRLARLYVGYLELAVDLGRQAH